MGKTKSKKKYCRPQKIKDALMDSPSSPRRIHRRQRVNKSDNTDEIIDKEFRRYSYEIGERTPRTAGTAREKPNCRSVVTEIVADLFTMGAEFSLAHCVAADMRMGRGIAVQFRRDFGRVDELLGQNQTAGGLAYLKVGANRFAYYLVTKYCSSGKPTLRTLFASLIKLRGHIQRANVRLLAMPRIGCGLDRLDWRQVKIMLEFVFQNVDVQIVVCVLQQDEGFNFNSAPAANSFTKYGGRVTEIEQDLFALGVDYSLAHCVAEDMRMDRGIAVQFRRDFKCVDELLDQRQKPGGLAYLQLDDGRYVYYLVTKRLSGDKPTLSNLFASLVKLRDHIQSTITSDGVQKRKLGMPRIACGLDGLKWDDVKYMIEFIFKEVEEIEIIVCNYQQDKIASHRSCKQFNTVKPVSLIEPQTLIIYLTTEDGHISNEMHDFDKKLKFLDDFRKRFRKQKNNKICAGDISIFKCNDAYYLCVCVVKKTEKDPLSYVHLQECIAKINKKNQKWDFDYVAFQAIRDRNDDCVNFKIINILRNSLTQQHVHLYVCWPGDLRREMPYLSC